MVIIRFHLVPLSDCCQQPKACYMRGTINAYNKELSDAVTYEHEILRALNTLRNKKRHFFEGDFGLTGGKKRYEIYRCHLQLRDTHLKN